MKTNEKNIQIPEKLFTQMAAYILMESYRTEEHYAEIEKGIHEKIDRKVNHDLYTLYKTAPTEQEREKARQDYLSRIGIPESFRW